MIQFTRPKPTRPDIIATFEEWAMIAAALYDNREVEFARRIEVALQKQNNMAGDLRGLEIKPEEEEILFTAIESVNKLLTDQKLHQINALQLKHWLLQGLETSPHWRRFDMACLDNSSADKVAACTVELGDGRRFRINIQELEFKSAVDSA